MHGELAPDPRRSLPAVDRLVAAVRAQAPELPGWAALAAARAVLAQARSRDPDGASAPAVPSRLGGLDAAAVAGALALARSSPQRVVNATGVLLHTNLGRARLAAGAAAAASAAATSYSALELDLASGRRGDRQGAVARKLALLAGAEAACLVNNNAAALVLAVSALAGGREVIVSRGELVEIGGSFRLPEMIAAAGARLVEVGTTNRTHPEDYRRAIGPETALFLKVHRSNFALCGFTAEVGLPVLAAIARDHALALVEDLGSATFRDLRGAGLPAESDATARLRLGADLVCFSGDKLFGGPQAGILVGRGDLVATLRRHPLARALRLDKMSLAALDWTAAALLAGDDAAIPALRQITEPIEEVARRAQALADRIAPIAAAAGLRIAIRESRAPIGGGSLPGFELPSWALALHDGPLGAAELAARLRAAPVPGVARVTDGAVLLAARTLCDDDADAVASGLSAALAPVRPPHPEVSD